MENSYIFLSQSYPLRERNLKKCHFTVYWGIPDQNDDGDYYMPYAGSLSIFIRFNSMEE